MMSWLSVATAATLVVVLMSGHQVAAQNSEQNLAFSLLDRYASPYGRPVENSTKPVSVKLGLTLIQIQQVDQEVGKLTATVFLNMVWQDDFLKWNEDDYEGVKRIGLSPEDIWTPDIEMFNAYHQPKMLLSGSPHVVVSSDGTCIYVPAYKINVPCPRDPDANKVTCEIKYGSWIYPMSLLKLESSSKYVDTKMYETNVDWELMLPLAKLNEKVYACCPDDVYGHISFSLPLKRRKPKVKQQPTNGATTFNFSDVTAAILAAVLVISTVL